jgi:hypothetical protein
LPGRGLLAWVPALLREEDLVGKEEFSIPPPEMFVEQLSPEGLDVLEQMQKMELSPEEAIAKMLELTPKDRVALWEINKYLAQAYAIEREHNAEGYR